MAPSAPILNTTDTGWPVLDGHYVTKTGPLFFSAVFQWCLFGVLCTQFIIYISAFPRDHRRNKLFVYTVFGLEIIQLTILTKSHFEIFASDFGDPQAYNRIGALWFGVPFMSGIVAFVAEIFYAMRLYLLSKSYCVPVAVCLLALIQVGGAISCAVYMQRAHLFSQMPQFALRITSGIWTSASALCDIVIAFYMTRYLWKRRALGTQTTQTLVRRIIRMVLETGTVTAVVAVIFLVLAVLPHHISYYQVPAAVLALVYSNSMLALLNSRINLNACRQIDTDATLPQTERPLTALCFCKSPRESALTGTIVSFAPSSNRAVRAGAARHLSFVARDSHRISGLPKSYEGCKCKIEERGIVNN